MVKKYENVNRTIPYLTPTYILSQFTEVRKNKLLKYILDFFSLFLKVNSISLNTF